MTNLTLKRKIEIHQDMVLLLKEKGDVYKDHLEHIQDCLEFLLCLEKKQTLCWDCIDIFLKENNILKTKAEIEENNNETDGVCGQCNETKKVYILAR